jgi:hypothetical protein
MARKTENRARADILRGKLLDLKFLKENQEFRADIARLNGMPNETMREVGARERDSVGRKKVGIVSLADNRTHRRGPRGFRVAGQQKD